MAAKKRVLETNSEINNTSLSKHSMKSNAWIEEKPKEKYSSPMAIEKEQMLLEDWMLLAREMAQKLDNKVIANTRSD